VKPKKNQQKQLHYLLNTAAATAFGKQHRFSELSGYREFSDRLPLQFYDDIDIKSLKKGEADRYWPGTISRYAVSAGTSGKGKHLPLTEDRLNSDRKFMRSVVFSYLRQRPNIFNLIGTHLSLPGTVKQLDNFIIGEISGFTGLQTPFWLKPFQLVPPRKLTRMDFKTKFELILRKVIDTDLRVIVAVPSWILTLFQEVLKKTGKDTIAEVWPNLKLLVCGGVKLANYRRHLEQLTGSLHPDFIETYGASEGYFAYSDDLRTNDLKLVTDHGIFYEFIADPLPDQKSMSIQETLPLWKVQAGIPYAMVVSTNAGLWRYALRDIVEFTSVDPPRIKIKGRVSEMLDDFGEGVYIYEAEEALEKAVKELGIRRSVFTIAPDLPSQTEVALHRWYVQFEDPIHPDTIEKVGEYIDRHLKKINRHYSIRRESGALGTPEVYSIDQVDINRWMEVAGKQNAQGKLPRVLRKHKDVFI